jgi:hypothetical protein
MTGPCPLCGQKGPLEGHHPTGRIHGRPIHPRFTFAICGPCNRAQNSLWRMAGIDAELPTAEVLMRRLTTWLTIWDRALDFHQHLALVEVLADLTDRVAEAA